MKTLPPRTEDGDLGPSLEAWREDAHRTAEDVDVHGRLVERVLAATAAQRPASGVPPAARWYAAAALLLIAVGVAGTFAVRARGPRNDTVAPRWADIQESLMDVMADDPQYAPGLGGR